MSFGKQTFFFSSDNVICLPGVTGAVTFATYPARAWGLPYRPSPALVIAGVMLALG